MVQPSRRFRALLATSLVALAAGACAPGATGDCSLSAIGPSTLPDARVAVPYSVQFSTQTTGTDCGSDLTFGIGDRRGPDLPPGLELSTDGLLSGTPTAAGDHWFTVLASISCEDDQVLGGFCFRNAPEATLRLTVLPH